MDVCIGNITAGELRVEFVKSLWASRVGDVPAATCHIFQVSGPYLDDARNFLVEAFLTQTTEDILLFIDSDISWEPEHLREVAGLVDPIDRPVVSGMYLSGFNTSELNGFAPVAFDWGTHSKTNKPFLKHIADDFTVTQPNDLRKVDAVGTGFLAVHRDLLQSMIDKYKPTGQPWFAEDVIDDVHHGEDFTFCIRLAEMGIPIYLAPNARVKHHKICTI